MATILTLALKDLRLLVRDRASLFFTIFFPLIFGIFFGTIFSPGSGDSGGIRVALVDLDKSTRSAALVASLKGAKELEVAMEAGNPPVELTPETAANLVRLGRRTAYIVIPKGYGAEDSGLFFPAAGDAAAIELGIDPSRAAEAGMLEGVLTRYAFEQFADVMRDPKATRAEVARARDAMKMVQDIDPIRRGLMETMFAGVDGLMADMQRREQSQPEAAAPADNTGFNPVQIKRSEVTRQRSGPRNSYAISFAQAIMWGVAGCAAAFGISLVVERSKGTLVRLRTAPLSWSGVLGGKALACFIATAGVSVGMLVVARLGFNVVPDSIALLSIAVACVCACFVGLMMLLAVLGRSEGSAGSIGWAVILVFMMIGGATVPLFFMPKWLQTLSVVSPVRWGILALEGAMWRGYSLTEMLLPCGVLLGVGAASMIVGVRLFKWTDG